VGCPVAFRVAAAVVTRNLADSRNGTRTKTTLTESPLMLAARPQHARTSEAGDHSPDQG